MRTISSKDTNVVIFNCLKDFQNEDDMNKWKKTTWMSEKKTTLVFSCLFSSLLLNICLHETRIHVRRLHTAISKLFFTPRARSSTSWDWRKEVELEVLRVVNQKKSEVWEIGIPRVVFSSRLALSGINRKLKKQVL